MGSTHFRSAVWAAVDAERDAKNYAWFLQGRLQRSNANVKEEFEIALLADTDYIMEYAKQFRGAWGI